MPFFSERDVEVPRLLSLVDAHSTEIATVLDVGCYGSQYLKQLKEKGKIVDGIDLSPGEVEKPFLRNYFVGNAITFPLEQYDLVICLSTIEHTGIKQYKVNDFAAEQNRLFKRLTDISKRYLYVTFPYGSPAFIEGECVVMTRNRVEQFLKQASPAASKVSFHFNETIWKFADWHEISQEQADRVQYDPAKGGRCICILEVIKEGD